METTSLVSGAWTPIDVVGGGQEYQTWMSYKSVSEMANANYYRLKRYSRSNPQDADDDGIDDLTELEYACLSPVDASDALSDYDGDGLDNSTELGLNTDPSDIDSDDDGRDDYYEVTAGTDPGDVMPATGLNMNWAYFCSPDYDFMQERTPAKWMPYRFFNADYSIPPDCLKRGCPVASQKGLEPRKGNHSY